MLQFAPLSLLQLAPPAARKCFPQYFYWQLITIRYLGTISRLVHILKTKHIADRCHPLKNIFPLLLQMSKFTFECRKQYFAGKLP